MNIDSIFIKRNNLSRGYQLTTDYRYLHSGYGYPDKVITRVEYFSKLIEYQFLPHYFGSPPEWRVLLRRIFGNRTLPDFSVVGPIKSGTSDLSVSIMLHPNVMSPLAKEFYYDDIDCWKWFYPTKKQKAAHEALHGLALSPFLSPHFHDMEVIYNLSRLSPKRKAVLVLNNPIKRLYSQWKWELFIAGKSRSSILPFLSDFSTYVNKALSVYPVCPMYTACGHQPLQTSIYWKAVEYWIECFGRENVLILDVNEYFSDKNIFLGKILDFVGLPSFIFPDFKKNINENPIILPSPDEKSVSMLKSFFEPHNNKLWEVMDMEFNW